MSQNSLVHTTSGTYPGANLVAQQNLMNDSLNSNQSGAAAPASRVAGSDWFDTTNKILKRSDSANSGWLTRQDWGVTTVTATGSLSGDNAGLVLIDATAGNIVLTLPAVATGKALPFMLKRVDTSANTVTVNISGGTNFRMLNRLTATSISMVGAGDFAFVIADGATNYEVLDRAPVVLLSTQVAAAVASVDFTTGINADFQKLELEISDYVPATTGTELWLRVSQASSFVTAANYGYGWGYTNNTTAGWGTGSLTDTKMMLANGITNGSGEGISGQFEMWNQAGTTNVKRALWDLAGRNSTSFARYYGGGAYIGNNTAVDGLRVMSSSGNITSGTFSLYGVRK